MHIDRRVHSRCVPHEFGVLCQHKRTFLTRIWRSSFGTLLLLSLCLFLFSGSVAGLVCRFYYSSIVPNSIKHSRKHGVLLFDKMELRPRRSCVHFLFYSLSMLRHSTISKSISAACIHRKRWAYTSFCVQFWTTVVKQKCMNTSYFPECMKQ